MELDVIINGKDVFDEQYRGLGYLLRNWSVSARSDHSLLDPAYSSAKLKLYLRWTAVAFNPQAFFTLGIYRHHGKSHLPLKLHNSHYGSP